MAGSSFGNIFRITTWGESHGSGVGVVVDGCPAGLSIDEAAVQAFLDRRRPGSNPYGTPRQEADAVSILSGVFEGKTTGTPISMMVENQTQRSGDYSEIASYYRPGHADYTFDEKYGFRDYRGGGRSSGRETIGRVAGGAIAEALLAELGVTVNAYTRSIGPMVIDYANCRLESIAKSSLYMPDLEASQQAEQYLQGKIGESDSVGGVVECIVKGLPAGVGTPVFEKLDANLAKAVMSIGAVKGFEIGSGFQAAAMCGSQNNDGFRMGTDGCVIKESNHAGGVLGGISDGSELILRAAFKPTPSIARTQNTVNKSGEEIEVNIEGRHDPIVVPRAVVVVESMVALALVDMLFENMSSQLCYIKNFYKD